MPSVPRWFNLFRRALTSAPAVYVRRRVTDVPAQPPPPAARARRTAADLLAVSAARAGLLAAWFAAQLVLARAVGPAAFGLYQLAVSIVRIATGVAGDPVDAAVMRSAPLHVRADRPRALATVRAAFAVRGGVGLACVAVAAVVPWAASWLVFKSVDHRGLAVLTAAGILGDLLLRSTLGYFQVAETFGRFLAVDVVWQLGRAAAVAALAAAGGLSAASAVGVYVAAPYLAFAVGLALLPRDVTRLALPRRADVAAVLHHAKWVAAATALGSVYERLDLLLLARFRGRAEVGLYAWAVFLAAVPDFLDGFVQTVLAPQVAPALAARRFNRLNRAYLAVAVPVGAAAAAAAVGLSPWALRTFTPAYAGSAGPFRLLVVGTTFNLVFTPLPAALLSYVAPRAAAALTAAGLAVVAVGGVALIPRFGATGAAAVILSARVGVGTGMAVLAARVGSRSAGLALQSTP